MKIRYRLLATHVLLGTLPFSAAAQASAPKPEAAETTRRGAITPPAALSPVPVVAPQITIRLVKPRPLTLDPPALQGGKAPPPGGINDAAARCEAQADRQLRAQCHDRLTSETPLRHPG
jgi:hypothetical protein